MQAVSPLKRHNVRTTLLSHEHTSCICRVLNGCLGGPHITDKQSRSRAFNACASQSILPCLHSLSRLNDVAAGMQNEEHSAAVTHQRKASNVYGLQGPPQKSPRIWKLAPNSGHPGATTVLPHEAVSLIPPFAYNTAVSRLDL